MIKIEPHKNLLFEKSKLIRQPVSLKKNCISFPGQNSDSAAVSTSSFVTRTIKSPSKQSSQRMKAKLQRQRQVQGHQGILENLSIPIDMQPPQNPELAMQRSSSYKISTAKMHRNIHHESDKNAKRVKTIKSARTSEDQNTFKNSQDSKQFYFKKVSETQATNKINQKNKGNFDLKNFMVNSGKGSLIICKSLTKQSQLDFFDNQISKLINKKVDQKLIEENDMSDQTSFNVVLQKIRQKNKSESSETDFQTKTLRYMDKLKKSALLLMETPEKKPYGSATESEANIFKSSSPSKKGNFKAALQWSSKRLEMMKSPFIKSMKSKKIMLEKQREKVKKEEDQIEGWIK